MCSFGGPLALAALSAPTLLAGTGDSAALAMLVAAAGFAVSLTIWLRYSEHVTGAGGLFGFVEAAVGRRVALAQAAVWIVSYLLYVIYTTVQIVYDLLPAVLPGERHYQTLLALLIPIAVAGVMIAGQTATLLVLGVIAGGQLVLAGVLDAVTVAHVSTPATSFGAAAPAGDLAKASAQTSLLYVCGSLPLFLGGELVRPTRTIRRGLIGAFLVTAIVILVAVAPLDAAPGLLRTGVPGVSVVGQFASSGLAQVIGVGVAVSIGGVIICEYLALTRLLQAIAGWRTRSIAVTIGAVIVATAPFSLINPDGFYNALVKPSLIALWLSQLVVFLVFPRFARRHGQRALPAWTMSLFAGGLAVYGLWTALQQASS